MSNPIKTNQIIHNWRVLKVTKIADLKITLIELKHERTGARYAHIANADTENTFAVAFKTIPEDSSGVAHILEHTVLTGSEKYPVRDPFFSMIKRSLASFMNAFTGNDWTAYPFATENKKDFYNLLSVYLDAAFFPCLTDLNFKQEGVRLEFDGTELKYKGVVYNEMKGSLSSPERIIEESFGKALFPNSCYRFNSGGEPEEIAQLTHAQLKAFHAKYYHPSNAYFYSYGNLPLAEHLRVIDEQVLARFKKEKIEATVRLEPRWAKARQFSYHFPLAESEPAEKKYQASLAWVLAKIEDAQEILVLEILEEILLASPSAPLRQALIASGLGSELADGSGLDTDYRQAIFSCGLKDIRQEDAARVKKLILGTLKTIVKKGFDPEEVAAAIRKLEFSHREVSNRPYPYGLKLQLRLLFPFLHGGKIVSALEFGKDIAAIRARLARGRYLEKKLEQYFLKNTHRAELLFVPDKNLSAQRDQEEKARLALVQQQLQPEDIKRIKEDARALQKLQEKTEDLSCLPSLRIVDIQKKIIPIKKDISLSQTGNTSFEQPTNGLFYFSTVFAPATLLERDWLLLPLFCHLLPLLGTDTKDYLALSRAIEKNSGGIDFSVSALGRCQTEGARFLISGSGRCLSGYLEKMQNVFQEIVASPVFSDLAMLKKFCKGYIANLESGLVENGHGLAMAAASRNLSQVQYLNERWHGLGQLLQIKQAVGNLDDAAVLQNLSERLAAIASLLAQSAVQNCLIGEKPVLKRAACLLKPSSRKQTSFNKDNIGQAFHLGKQRIFEGYIVAADVSYLGAAFPVARIGHADAPALYVLAKILGRQFFHTEIREKGGAYGGIAKYDYTDGVFCFGSYRDPHILGTLEIFGRAKAFILSNAYSEENIQEAILQACAGLDSPGAPYEKAQAQFGRDLYGLKDGLRQSFKKGILSVTRSEINNVAAKYLSDSGLDYNIAILSNKNRLEKAKKSLGPDFKLIEL